ncbi:ROK family transcriptional regulator [Paractinoplanes globisporus]|uniref:ROK family protein n=1 Tax=Paractinoplanes globisporus TaxID=113565 RepID=A0ABW6WBZ4_9ACTN|nr:ROK family protein [Actinoplanes globisporus]
MAVSGSAARPRLIRALNEQLMLDHIRTTGSLSRADLARISGLAKNTVSLALGNLERAGLVRPAGVRTGVPGPAAVLYEVNPDSGFVLGLDVGGQYLRGAIADSAGAVRARATLRARARTGHGRVAALAKLGADLRAEAGFGPGALGQTVLGSPGIYDPAHDTLTLAAGLPGWGEPAVLRELRRTFGTEMVLENDIDAAALAEQAHGHGRDVTSFAFISVGTGIGMGLVIDGKLHRGAHGAAGEIGFLPMDDDRVDLDDVRRLGGGLETVASAGGIVRAARLAGMHGPLSARTVFEAAARGDARARGVVEAEAVLIARAVCAVIAVADPHLIVLGGGVGQAADFLERVAARVRELAPVEPAMRVSALGNDAVVDGCLAAGADRLWERLTAGLAPDTTAIGGIREPV